MTGTRLRLAVAILAIAVVGATGGYLLAREPGASLAASASGDLLARVEQLVAAMPGPESDAYVPPTPPEAKRMHDAYAAIVGGDLDDAASLAAPLGYRVGRYTDTGTGRELIVLFEPQTSRARHWGLFFHDPTATTRLVVEVAHALDDRNTPQVGVATFRMAHASDLFVAGASRFAGVRGSADMAHAPVSVFVSLTEAIAAPGVVVYQPHGFEEAGHTDYGDVVVSNGTFPPDALTQRVAANLRADGFKVCVYDGVHCSRLGGTTNVDGSTARDAGATFLHIETSDAIRASDSARLLVARAVAAAVG